MIKHDNQNIQSHCSTFYVLVCCGNWVDLKLRFMILFSFHFSLVFVLCALCFFLLLFINKQSTIKWCIICRYSIILDCFTSISSMALFPTAIWNNRKWMVFFSFHIIKKLRKTETENNKIHHIGSTRFWYIADWITL